MDLVIGGRHIFVLPKGRICLGINMSILEGNLALVGRRRGYDISGQHASFFVWLAVFV